MMLAEAERNS